MTYLNTGLNLRLPLESDYNAFRRFLITNRHAGLNIYSSLSRQLKQRSAKWKGKPALELAQLAERKRCEELGIDYQTPHPLEPSVAILNCPECAQQCYHNYLYQYPWFIRCPFHDLPLVEQCPGCHQDWPTPGTLNKRHCSICGSNLKMSNILIKRKLKESDFQHLRQIESAISYHDSIKKAYLFSGQCDPKGCHKHHSIEPHSLHFPSYVCALDSRYHAFFCKLGINIEKTVQKKYGLEGTTKKPSCSVTKAVLERSQARIQKQILSSINKRFHIQLEEVEVPWCDQYQRIETLPRLLKTTYNIWLGLLSNGVAYSGELDQ
ncbi:MAG: hypothetical protein GY938_20630 [Ketobacter sp.]|nr:hypothetical protein [Ketobacter sp.]